MSVNSLSQAVRQKTGSNLTAKEKAMDVMTIASGMFIGNLLTIVTILFIQGAAGVAAANQNEEGED